MKHTEIITKLADMVRVAGSQKVIADQLGISSAYLGDILRGRRTPGPRVLKALGMVRETIYKETKQ